MCVAAAIAGTAVVGGAISSDASRHAANTQADAAKNAANLTQQQFNTINAQGQPARTAANNSLADIGFGFGQNNQGAGAGIDKNFFSHQFNNNDLNANLAPNYQFQLGQGEGQVRNAENATGGLLSGNTLQGLNTFSQNFAQNAYQNAFQNYTGNQTNIFNRLADI